MAIDTIKSSAITDGTISTSDIADGAINNAKVDTNAGIVTTKISGLDAAIDGGLGRLENEVGLLNVNRLVDNSAVVDDFVKGFSDAFTDETGVNTGANSNASYFASSDTYALSQLVSTTTEFGANNTYWQGNLSNWTFGFSNTDGNAFGVESSESSLGSNARTQIRTIAAYGMTGDFVQFRLNNTSNVSGGVGIVDKNFAAYIPGDTTGNYPRLNIFQGNATSWNAFAGDPRAAAGGVKGSFLNFSGTNLSAYNVGGSASGNVTYSGGNSGTVVTLGLDPSTRYLYAKLDGTLNTTINNHWSSGTEATNIPDDYYICLYGFQEGYNADFDFFKVTQSFGNAAAVSTFQSQARTAVSTPNTVRLVLLGKEEQTQVLNTDTVFSISRNNASNFSPITMTESGTYNSAGVKIYTGTVDVSGQPSGTQIVLKMTTTANKGFTLHGYSLLYK